MSSRVEGQADRWRRRRDLDAVARRHREHVRAREVPGSPEAVVYAAFARLADQITANLRALRVGRSGDAGVSGAACRGRLLDIDATSR